MYIDKILMHQGQNHLILYKNNMSVLALYDAGRDEALYDAGRDD